MKSPEDHIDSVRERFSTLDAYRSKLAEADDRGWANRYPETMELYGRLYLERNVHVTSLASGGERLLDVGCGMGDVLALLADHYDELHGIDPSDGFCEQARRELEARVSNPVRIRPGVCENLDYPDGYFDTVLLLDVFEHIETAWRHAALKEIHRVLRPGGELIISTPSRPILRFWNVIDNFLTLPSQLRRGGRIQLWQFQEKEHPEVFVTRKELFASLRQAGFSIGQFRRVGFFPAPERTGFLDSWLPRIHARPRLQKLFGKGFRLMERASFLNQKMNARAQKPNSH